LADGAVFRPGNVPGAAAARGAELRIAYCTCHELPIVIFEVFTFQRGHALHLRARPCQVVFRLLALLLRNALQGGHPFHAVQALVRRGDLPLQLLALLQQRPLPVAVRVIPAHVPQLLVDLADPLLVGVQPAGNVLVLLQHLPLVLIGRQAGQRLAQQLPVSLVAAVAVAVPDVRIFGVKQADIIRSALDLGRFKHNSFSRRYDGVIVRSVCFVEDFNRFRHIANRGGAYILDVFKVPAPIKHRFGHAAWCCPISIVLQAIILIFGQYLQEGNQLPL